MGHGIPEDDDLGPNFPQIEADPGFGNLWLNNMIKSLEFIHQKQVSKGCVAGLFEEFWICLHQAHGIISINDAKINLSAITQ
jgi:hypothetical protein